MTAGEFLRGLLHAQFVATIPVPETTEFKGKTVIVTGSNTGLGLEAVRHFVRLGAGQVIIACRSTEKGENAKQDLVSTHPAAETVVEVWQLDLGSYASVKAFAKKAGSLERIDILVENAGISTRNFKLVEEDETSITTNVVSTYLLALLMLPQLRSTAEKYATTPHLVIVSSDTHYMVDLAERKHDHIFQALSDPQKADMANRYPNSKLLEVLITREIVKERMSANYPVVFNLVNPGFCHSSLTREEGYGVLAMKYLLNARSTECGGRTLVHAAYSGPESHGKFLMNTIVTQPSSFVLSEEGAQTQSRVWKELSEKLEKIQPGILQNI